MSSRALRRKRDTHRRRRVGHVEQQIGLGRGGEIETSAASPPRQHVIAARANTRHGIGEAERREPLAQRRDPPL